MTRAYLYASLLALAIIVPTAFVVGSIVRGIG